MADTYTQIHIHVVFAVMGRESIIQSKAADSLEKYLSGIIRNKEQKLVAIKCMPDHVHILIGLRPSMALSDLVRDVKNNSTRFMNENFMVVGKFHWQEGFGAFSYSKSQLDAVISYINNQEKHHQRRTFQEEYVEMLEKFAVEYDAKYLFAPVDSESN